MMISGCQIAKAGVAKQEVMSVLGLQYQENEGLDLRGRETPSQQLKLESIETGKILLSESIEAFTEEARRNDKSFNLHYEAANFETLCNEIQQVEVERKKRGKPVTTMFSRFCKTLDSHSALLGLVPSQSIYCSLFCGAITCIVKASVNHSNITDGFAQALEEISEDIPQAIDVGSIHNDQRVLDILDDLYGHYASFLDQSLKWYKVRLWRSLVISNNQNFYIEVKSKVETIRNIFRRLFLQAGIAHDEFTRDTLQSLQLDVGNNFDHVSSQLEGISTENKKLATENTLQNLQLEVRENFERIFVRLEKDDALFQLLSETLRETKEAKRQEENNQRAEELRSRLEEHDYAFLGLMGLPDIGNDQSDTSMQQQTQHIDPRGISNGDGPSSNNGKAIFSDNNDSQKNFTREVSNDKSAKSSCESKDPTNSKQGRMKRTKTYTVFQVREDASCMLKHISNVRRFMSSVSHASTPEDSSIKFETSDWISSAIPILWLSELDENELYPSTASSQAAHVISLALQLGIPTIAFFCRFSYDYDRCDLRNGARLCLTDMVFNIIRQLVDFLPSNFDSEIDFSEQRFAALEYGYTDVDNALELLRDLLMLAPSVMLFVIDGIEHLDSKEVEVGVQRFLAVLLWEIGELQKSKKGVAKILFSTAREYESLLEIAMMGRGVMRRINVLPVPGMLRKRIEVLDS